MQVRRFNPFPPDAGVERHSLTSPPPSFTPALWRPGLPDWACSVAARAGLPGKPLRALPCCARSPPRPAAQGTSRLAPSTRPRFLSPLLPGPSPQPVRQPRSPLSSLGAGPLLGDHRCGARNRSAWGSSRWRPHCCVRGAAEPAAVRVQVSGDPRAAEKRGGDALEEERGGGEDARHRASRAVLGCSRNTKG
jgi:hypothetical protein